MNRRTDEYGGTIENRCRFPLAVIKAVTDATGAGRVGIRLSPYNYFQDTKDSNPNAHWQYLCTQIAALPDDQRPAYVHMVEPRFDEVLDEQAKLDALAAYTDPKGVEAEATVKPQRHSLDLFRGPLRKGCVALLAAGNFNSENSVSKLATNSAEAIAFGRLFIANPDLPRRLQEGLPLNTYDRTTFYGANPPEKGYTDYPAYGEET